VRPGTDDQALVCACDCASSTLLHTSVIRQGRPQEEVVPAADIERGHGDVFVALTWRDAPPVIVVGGMRQPLQIKRRKLAQERLIGEREMLKECRWITHHLHEGSHLFLTGPSLAQPPLQFLKNHTQGPGERASQIEHATLVTKRRLVKVRGSHHRSKSTQGFWMLFRQQPLRESEVRPTHHAYLVTRPRLLDDPVDRINSIAGFIDRRGERALGGKTPPAILKDDHIPLLHGSESIDRGLCNLSQRLFIIGEAREEDRELSLLNWAIHISGKFDAIARGNHDVFFNQNVHCIPFVFLL